MICHVCGGEYTQVRDDMPFKLPANRIVIVRELPVPQCGQCSDYAIEDGVVRRLEELLDRADASAELEVLRYAA